MIKLIREWSGQFVSLFYPRLCLICERELITGESHICLHCLNEMPRTGFHNRIGNPVEQLFYGKADIEKASGYFFFHQQSDFRKAIHAIKYRNEKEAGYELGRKYGEELLASGSYTNIDIVIPVPLHKKRLRKRGYNQSEWIARGIATGLKKPVKTDILYRNSCNSSQTSKSVYDRWLNTHQIFTVRKNNILTNKHFLLVDDVVTTGATLLACALALKAQIPDCKISIVSLAVAE